MKSKVKYRFTPNLLSAFFNPNYIVRSSIWNSVRSYAEGASGNLLDFGAGESPYRALFKDVSYNSVDLGSDGHEKFAEDITIYDGKTINAKNDKYDCIVATEVFEHVFDLDKTLLELNRVLKSKGTLFGSIPFNIHEHEIPYDFARYTRFGLTYLFEKNGYVVKFIRGNSIPIITLMQHLLWRIWQAYKNPNIISKVFLAILLAFLVPSINLTACLLERIYGVDAKYDSEWPLNYIFLVEKS